MHYSAHQGKYNQDRAGAHTLDYKHIKSHTNQERIIMAQKEQTTNEAPKVQFYKKASFPWAIIVISLVAATSFISGWHLNGLHTQSIEAKADAKAAHMVQLSKEVK